MKGVILAAGYGTRFLPVTKTIPKEMLPLVDKPSIDFIIEEFLGSGIEEILVVTSRRKKALEDYLDREIELESIFGAQGAQSRLETIRPPRAGIFFVRQQEMLGTGHALMTTRPFVGEDPFVVAYPDDLHIGEVPLAKQLIDVYKRTGCSVLATVFDPPEVHRYGTIAIAEDGLHVTRLVEKAPPGSEPSREASLGRFLYTPEIFPALEAGWKKHDPSGGEYFHTDAVNTLAARGKVVFRRWEGERLDTGKPDGFFRSILRYAQSVPELKEVYDRFVAEQGGEPGRS
ncbi:MAG: NTP transferase domain-containing protein [Spirochaetales bacterium]|nr:NTP transferase domain-containing protein [Spirochaetales bacterium]